MSCSVDHSIGLSICLLINRSIDLSLPHPTEQASKMSAPRSPSCARSSRNTCKISKEGAVEAKEVEELRGKTRLHEQL